jgi:hypothetical protein
MKYKHHIVAVKKKMRRGRLFFNNCLFAEYLEASGSGKRKTCQGKTVI